ncbi:MAG: 6-phosphogluconolactonase [Planctomycetota bacterium]
MLKLGGSVHVSPDKEALFGALGDALLGAAVRAVEARGVFHLALSGGGTPEPFYVRLVTDLRYRGLPWDQTHVWVVDERCVPETDEKSNIKMMREAMLDHAGIPKRQVHAMPVLEPDSAERYQAELIEHIGGSKTEVPVLDWVLLGMGGDCHTASLFPESPALSVTDKWVATNDGERVVPPARLTMTYPLLNAARELVVLLAGTGKYEALKRVEVQAAKGEPDVQEIPISGIDPEPSGGELTWFLDEAAATGAP